MQGFPFIIKKLYMLCLDLNKLYNFKIKCTPGANKKIPFYKIIKNIL